MILNPFFLIAVLFSFLNSSFNAYLTIYTFFITYMISKFSGIIFQIKAYIYFCPVLLKYPGDPLWITVEIRLKKKKRVRKEKKKTYIVINLQFYLLGPLYLLCQGGQCFPVRVKEKQLFSLSV